MTGEEAFVRLIEQVTERAEKMGLYVRHVAVSSSADPEEMEKGDPRELMEAGAEFIVQIAFQIGEVAWTDRILNPDAYDERKQFELMMPSEEELMLERMREEMGGGEFFRGLDEE